MDYMVWIWLAIFIFCLIVEGVTFDLVSIWFALASLVVLIIAITTDLAYYYQILIFALVSLITLILTRPFLRHFLKNQERQTNVDDFIGKEVLVIKEVTKFNPGQVKINDVIYQAILQEQDDTTLNCGDIVVITGIKGNKVVVMKR